MDVNLTLGDHFAIHTHTHTHAHIYMKRCSKSLVIRKIQIKTVITYCFTTTRVGKKRKKQEKTYK